MIKFIHVDLFDGGNVLINPKHIVSLKSRVEGMDTYYNIHLSNGEILKSMYTWDEIESLSFGEYLERISNQK